MNITPSWYTKPTQHFMVDYLRGLTIGGKLEQMVNASANHYKNSLLKNGKSTEKVEQYAADLHDHLFKGNIIPATPEWMNLGNDNGLSISCYGSNIEDSIESLVAAQAEISVMIKHHGGTSAIVSMREKGAKFKGGIANGPVFYLNPIQSNINHITQGSSRRGHCAVWMDVTDPSIMSFLEMRSVGHTIQDLSFGVVIPEGWMDAMLEGNKEYQAIWARIIGCRIDIGYPFIMFQDNARKGAPEVYRDNWEEYAIKHTNMCTEIMLPNNQDESFVCCLMSMNTARYDHWKDTNAVEVATIFLDTVITDFIEGASKLKFMERAVRFATRHRAIGIGQQGWHTYLQSKLIPYESIDARMLNLKIASQIREQSYAASEQLAADLGPCLVCEEHGVARRNTTTMAIAPTKSTAFIAGQNSEAAEPLQSNYFIDDKQKIKYTFKNPKLEEVLEEYGQNTAEVWHSIKVNRGSVQHLEFLPDELKSVFKTFSEISQKEVIIQTADRQKYYDQGQSLNIMIHPDASARDVSNLYIDGWKRGIKSFYYQKGVSAAQEFSRSLLEECVACEG